MSRITACNGVVAGSSPARAFVFCSSVGRAPKLLLALLSDQLYTQAGIGEPTRLQIGCNFRCGGSTPSLRAFVHIRGWSNGKTTRFERVDAGSIPAPRIVVYLRGSAGKGWFLLINPQCSRTPADLSPAGVLFSLRSKGYKISVCPNE